MVLRALLQSRYINNIIYVYINIYLYIRILVIGDAETGKTSIIQRYVYKTFDEHHNATLGVNFALKRLRVEDTLLNVQLWDIAGQERFIGLAPTYYKHAVAAIVVIDITKKQTLINAKKWKNDVDDKVFLRDGDNIPVVLFANKVCDYIII